MINFLNACQVYSLEFVFKIKSVCSIISHAIYPLIYDNCDNACFRLIIIIKSEVWLVCHLFKFRSWNNGLSIFLRQVYQLSPEKIMGHYLITIKPLLKLISAHPWSTYDDSMCDITHLRAINNRVGKWIHFFSNDTLKRFVGNERFCKLIRISLNHDHARLKISQHWFR